MKKERLEQLGKEYLEIRGNKEAIENFIARFTATELAEIRKYVVENLLDSRSIETLTAAGYTVESYIEKQNEIISKEVEAWEGEFSCEYIIEQQTALELSGCRTLDGFMTNNYKFDWNKDPFYIALRNMLNQTMFYDQILGCWIDKDIC